MLTNPEAPAEELAVCDLWAAEAYLTALDAGEPAMLAMLNRGEKIHEWCWHTIKKQFPDLLPDTFKSKTGFNYKAAKQFIHSLNYNVMPDRMAAESGMPLFACQWFYEYYHMSFPGIKGRQARIKRAVETTRSISSPLGRKRIYFQPFGVEVMNSAFAWPSQSCIGEITNIALARLMHWGRHGNPWILPALNTHDGLASRCYVGNRDAVTAKIKTAFNVPITLRGLTITIPVEVQFGPNFNDLGDTRLCTYGAS